MQYIQDFRNIHEGETCVILGNGPSLKQVDFDHLEQYTVFGTNRIYLSGFTPDYFVSVNDLLIEQFVDEMKEVKAPKFITHRAKGTFGPGDDVIWINTDSNKPVFATDMSGAIWEGHTVTFVALQLAYHMGFQEVILSGVDHYFQTKGEPNAAVQSRGPDPNHFDPEYFGEGVKWNLPDLEKSEIAYSLAKNAFEKDGRKVVNATHRTRLKTFPLMNPNRLTKHEVPKVSAIISAYYAEDYLGGCIEDLMQQTICNDGKLEIVVVCQSGSEEEGIAHSFPIGKTKIKTVLTDDIPTIYKAWNLGIEAARGKYLTNANADDRHNPIAYELMAEILDGNDHIDLVYHNQYITWEPNTTWKEFVSKKDRDLVGGRVQGREGVFAWHDYSKKTLIQGCFIGPQPMWRATLHQLHGGFNETYESAGDYEFWIRIAKEDNMFHISEPLGLYLARDDGKELSDPEQNAAESIYARTDNGGEGLLSNILAKDMIMLSIGGEYVVTNYASIMGLVRHTERSLEQYGVELPLREQETGAKGEVI